jgi:hypothetical protein
VNNLGKVVNKEMENHFSNIKMLDNMVTEFYKKSTNEIETHGYNILLLQNKYDNLDIEKQEEF